MVRFGNAVLAAMLVTPAALGVRDTSGGQQQSLRAGETWPSWNSDSTPQKAITYSGGGFRAHVVGAAVTASLMADSSASTGDRKLASVFGNTQVMGSNSGGSWFLAQLLYSPNFVEMLNEISEAPTAAAAASIYNDKWVRVLQRSSSGPRQLLSSAGDDDGEPGSESNAIEWDTVLRWLVINGSRFIGQWGQMLIQHGWRSGLNWGDFVKAVLEIPGDLDATQSLNEATPVSWSLGKTIGIAGALVTVPTSSSTGGFGVFAAQCSNNELASITGQVDVPDLDQYAAGAKLAIPLTFSVKMGDKSASAPWKSMTLPRQGKLSGNVLTLGPPNPWSWVPNNFGVAQGTTPIDNFQDDLFMNDNNQVRIVDAVTTSSAWLSQVISHYAELPRVVLNLSRGLWRNLLNLAVYASVDSQPSEAFTTADAARRPDPSTPCDEWTSSMTSSPILTLADGGYVDNSAAGKLVGEMPSGSSIVVVLNTQDDSWTDLEYIFSAKQDSGSDTFTQFPVFEEDNTYLDARLPSFSKFQIDSSIYEYLSSIDYGSLEVTTKFQPFFNVEAGKKITLHVIRCDTKLWLADENWDKMAKLVGEIVTVMKSPQNAGAIKTIRSWL